MIIEALKCADCGRIGISVEDKRVTDHKCSGSWIPLAVVGVRWTRAGLTFEDLTAKFLAARNKSKSNAAVSAAFDKLTKPWRRKP